MEIKREYIGAGRPNRPGKANPMKYITIHETGNASRGAGAKAHASYLRNTTDKVSWHYTVDDGTVYQHLPDNESAYHAGDGANGPGNAQSIGIEICVNADGDFDAACKNAAWLVGKLMREHGIPIGNVKQHYDWNGKDCPKNIRHTGKWEVFIEMCKSAANPSPATPVYTPSAWAKASWEKAVAKGITDGLRPQDQCTREELVTMLDRAGVLG